MHPFLLAVLILLAFVGLAFLATWVASEWFGLELEAMAWGILVFSIGLAISAFIFFGHIYTLLVAAAK